MKNVLSNQESLFSSNEINQIIRKYNQLFSLFGYELKHKFGLKDNDTIVKIQRGFINDNNHVFWDYLGATHRIMGEVLNTKKGLNLESAYGCIKFIFGSGESLIISTNSFPCEVPKGIVSLDSCYLTLNHLERKNFDNILLGINKLEYKHFHSKSFQASLKLIREISSDEIFKILNIIECLQN